MRAAAPSHSRPGKQPTNDRQGLTMSGITRKPAFWIAFALLSAAAGVYAWRYFPQALPIINLEVKMSRDDALLRAATMPSSTQTAERKKAAM